jgi:subtilisin family serine protease
MLQRVLGNIQGGAQMFIKLALLLIFFSSSVFSKVATSSSISKILFTDEVSFDKSLAKKCGLHFKGEVVVLLKGSLSSFKCFEGTSPVPKLLQGKTSQAGIYSDELVMVKSLPASPTYDAQLDFLAKREFGLNQFWKDHPKSDGRGVILGVIDNGVSPVHNGLLITTDHKRKYLKHFSRSSYFTYQLEKGQNANIHNDVRLNFLSGELKDQIQEYYVGLVDENKKGLLNVGFDLNRDKSFGLFQVVVFKTDATYICFDTFQKDIDIFKENCSKSFNQSGEFRFWDKDKRLARMSEFDPSSLKVSFSSGEEKWDSHGEGVASVSVGHLVGGKYDGIAPGAQLVDYDLSEFSANNIEENFYSMGTFINALEVLGQNKVQVANISYSLFFLSAKAQKIMRAALEKVIKHYKMIVVFSAGNNGPGLFSFNRGAIYPRHGLVAGAYLSREGAEYVHGVTGLPEEGQMVYYSSRGPGVHGGMGTFLISPLASLTHADPFRGYNAFSGTSSAAPALAGLASVLISHIQNLKLPYDYKAIIHALKLSGKRLSSFSYIEQGFGLPQIDTAVAVYKKLVQGKLFLDTGVQSRVFKSSQGEKAKGRVIYKSQLDKMSGNDRLLISSVASSSLSTQVEMNQLNALEIEYSHNFLTGPRYLWTSVGSSQMSYFLDKSLVDWEANKNGKIFAEIRFKDKETGLLVSVYPLTLIDDKLLNTHVSFEFSLGPDMGSNAHFKVPAGVIGLKVHAQNLLGDGDQISLKLYDPSGIKSGSKLIANGDTELIYAVKGPGAYQFGVAKYRGAAPVDGKKIFRLTVAPIMATLKTQFLDLSKDKNTVVVENQGPMPVTGSLFGQTVSKALKTQMAMVKKHSRVTFEGTVELPQTVGDVEFKIGAQHQNPYSYAYMSCLYTHYKMNNGKKSIVKMVKGNETYSVEKKHLKGHHPHFLSYQCGFFDFWKNEKKGKASSKDDLLMMVLKVSFQENLLLFENHPVKLLPGLNTLSLPQVTEEKLQRLKKFGLWLGPLFVKDGARIKIGELDNISGH